MNSSPLEDLLSRLEFADIGITERAEPNEDFHERRVEISLKFSKSSQLAGNV
ncbi:MAG: hypothetical protein II954_07470 [Synergistaceae bacterium]|nr:hypothetical protein [Synergistaceae bacterium]